MRRRIAAAALTPAAAFLLVAATAFGWSFGVCGDSRNDVNGIFPRILSAVERSGMEFLLHTGDLESPGGERSWEAFRAKAAGFRKPLRVLIGNHELYGGGSRESFVKFFALPGTSYSFTHRDAHFALVDNAGGSLDEAALAWLDRDLLEHPKGNGGVRHQVVAMHIPPQTETLAPHGTRRGYAEQSRKLLSILKRHGVDLVLCSHEHMHAVEDWEGIPVIVSGGAGAPLLPFQRFGFYEIDVGPERIGWRFVPVRPDR